VVTPSMEGACSAERWLPECGAWTIPIEVRSTSSLVYVAVFRVALRGHRGAEEQGVGRPGRGWVAAVGADGLNTSASQVRVSHVRRNGRLSYHASAPGSPPDVDRGASQ